MNNVRTKDISFRLRTWAERIRSKNRNQYELLCAAADRLDDLDERVAIMTEHEYRDNPVFPPEDSELTDSINGGD